MEDDKLFGRIRELEKLTPSETKITNYLESNYSSLAFETITSIGKGAGVGTATVGRFIHRLGYADFADFIKKVRGEVVGRLESPLDRYKIRRETLSEDRSDILGRHIEYATRNMHETQARVSDADIKKAAGLLTRDKGSLYVCGGASAQAIARYFFILSKYIRKNVIFLSGDISTLSHKMVDVCPDDSLLAISHKRYSRPTMKIASWFNQRKAAVIAITDRETSPLSKLSDVLFIVRSEGPAMFNSRLVSLLLVETLIEAMVFESEEHVTKRFRVFEELFRELGVYAEDS